MKKLLVGVVFCLATVSLYAQKDTASEQKSDGFKYKSERLEFIPYLGMIVGGDFNTQSTTLTDWGSGRAGAKFEYFNKAHTLSFATEGIGQGGTDTTYFHLSQASVNGHLGKWKISAGQIVTSVGELRPAIATNDGLFGNFAEELIAYDRTGGKIAYASGLTKISVSATVNREDHNNPMISGMFQQGEQRKVGFGGSVGENAWSAVAKLDTKHFFSITTLTKVKDDPELPPQDQLLANFSAIKFGKLDIYSDMEFNVSKDEHMRGEWGVRRNFNSEDFGTDDFPFAGLVGIGLRTEEVMGKEITSVRVSFLFGLK